ncbi:MAG: hypothetical protein ISR64_06305 [Deltaproteobacteria bacterium]|nr:hypothetical protein [Deltaproteobacteria bacterium]
MKTLRLSMVLPVLLALASTTCGGGSEGNGAPDTTVDVPGDPGFSDPGPPPTDVFETFLETTGDPGVPDAAKDAPSEIAPEVALDVPPDDPGPPQPWRSLLYPMDWTHGLTDDEGRFLHDFSFAGYHNGEDPIQPGGAFPLVVEDVLAYEADPTGATDSTAAIQAAIDAVASAGGGSVYIPPGFYRVDGQLVVKSSFTVIRGDGADLSQLHFTQFLGMTHKGHILFMGAQSIEAETPLANDGDSLDTIIEVKDAGAFGVGDDVQIGWVITPEFVEAHGMTGTWGPYNGTWQPFFHRDVTAVDVGSTPHTITVDVPLRYPALASNGASVRRISGIIEECGVEDLGVADAVGWDDAWSLNQVHVIEFRGVKDSWMTGIESFPSPLAPPDSFVPNAHVQSGGLQVIMSKRVTVADCHMGFAQNRGGGGNGYLFDLRQSSEVLVRDCVGEAGRHNFLQNAGFGLTGCVWLRITSRDGEVFWSKDIDIGMIGPSEYHHSLATANLVDSSVIDDGWNAVNRGMKSSGSGHSSTQCVLWNILGGGKINSYQFGWGYVIGTGPDIATQNWMPDFLLGNGTEPEDWLEGEGQAALLEPQSLYEDQLARRLDLKR